MTVTEANEKLTELQIAMVKLVNEYEESTGLVVQSLYVAGKSYVEKFPDQFRVVASVELPRQAEVKGEK